MRWQQSAFEATTERHEIMKKLIELREKKAGLIVEMRTLHGKENLETNEEIRRREFERVDHVQYN